jgi:hypothetical protein
MSIAPLLSLVGIAAGPVAEVAARAIENFDFPSLLGSAKTSPDPQETSAPAISVSDLASQAKDALAKFRDFLAPRLAELGVDLSQPVLLALDSWGNVRETSGHAQGALIEQLFATEEGLRESLQQVALHFETLRVTDEQQRFQDLYAQNPELAVAQYSHLFDDQRQAPQFQLELLGDEMNPVFGAT